jgi:hypothetical protein
LKVRLGSWEGVVERPGERMVIAERGLSMAMPRCASRFMSMSMSRLAALSGDELLKDERSSSDRLRLSSIVRLLFLTGLDGVSIAVWPLIPSLT